MPTFDGTGPEGLGVKTGRGFGPCGTRRPTNFKHERGNVFCPACGKGYCAGIGGGAGPRMNNGLGRRREWFAVGYESKSHIRMQQH